MEVLAKSWVDLASIVFGIVYVWGLHRNAKLNGNLVSLATGMVFLEGLSIAPLMLMIPASFVPAVLTSVVESSRLTLLSAAVLAILAIVGPRWNSPAAIAATP